MAPSIPSESYCQATGTGTGDGNPVPGDDSIISQATHHIPDCSPTIYPTAHPITQTAHFPKLLISNNSIVLLPELDTVVP